MCCARNEQTGVFLSIPKILKNILGLHDIARLILILYCLASIFKTIIDTIFIYTVFDTISRLCCQECKESCLVLKITTFSNRNNLSSKSLWLI